LDLGHECRAIGDRSFSSDIKSAVNLATAFIDGMHQAGMASTGKHFPGHGHVLADSHLETPYDDRTKDEIFSCDLQPFQQLISQNKLDAIMPAHVIYRQCDSQPASGSEYWLKDILRKQLNFQGAIFSDDLGMKGACVMGDFVDRSKKALNAGCDLLLLCNEREGVIQVLDNLKLTENEPHFMARQARLQNLFKRREIEWNDLVLDQRWKLNHRNLADIQSRWLDIQAARK
jgi:beta-L-N-acetylhexosaminidase